MQHHLSKIKNTIKSSIGFLFKFYCGVYNPFKNKTTILMYHRVFDPPDGYIYDSSMFVKPQSFELHIQELSKYFKFKSIDDPICHQYKLPCCIITFDDGWLDNYTNAYPILKKYNIPGTIFLPLEFVDNSEDFWFHKIALLINEAKNVGDEKRFILIINEILKIDIQDELNESVLLNITRALKSYAPARIDEIILEIEKQFMFDNRNNIQLLTWEQIREMSENNISFGSHTLNHTILTNIKVDDQQREIFDSFKRLKEKEWVNLSMYFCYPNGNYNDSIINFTKEAGYIGATTTDLGVNSKNQNRYTLKRVELHDEVSNSVNLLWFRLFQSLFA